MKYLGYISVVFLECLFSLNLSAQKTHEHNRYSLEASWGMASPLTQIPKTLDYRKLTFNHPELAWRMMFNPRWGIRVSGSYNIFKATRDANLDFKTIDLRLTGEAIWNIGRSFHFERHTKNISLLMHLGGGVSSLRDARTNWLRTWRTNHGDDKFNLLMGFTGQYRFNPRWVFHANLTALTHFSQHYEFNFGPKIVEPIAIRGWVFNSHIGITRYFGDKKEHYDWVFPATEKPDLPVKDSISKPPPVLADRDGDGVPDLEDKCPDAPGLKALAGCAPPENSGECLLEEFPILLFDVSMTQLSQKDKKSLDSLVICLQLNPSKKFIIHGHSDNLGDQVAIDDIAYRRALSAKRYLTEHGIDKDRLLAIAEGAEKPKLPDSVLKKIGNNRLVYFEAISNNVFDIIERKNGAHLQGLFFTVQVGAYGNEINSDKLDELGRVLVSKSPDKSYQRYSIGVFHSSEEAGAFLESLKAKGLFPDGFVTAYYLGERISNKRAKNILLEKGNKVLEP